MKTYINLLFNKYFIVSSLAMPSTVIPISQINSELTYDTVIRSMKKLSSYIFSERSVEPLEMLVREYNDKMIYYSPEKDGIPTFINYEDAENFKRIIDCKLLLVNLRDN